MTTEIDNGDDIFDTAFAEAAAAAEKSVQDAPDTKAADDAALAEADAAAKAETDAGKTADELAAEQKTADDAAQAAVNQTHLVEMREIDRKQRRCRQP